MRGSVDEAQLSRADLEHLAGLSLDEQFSTVLGWLAGRASRRSDLAIGVMEYLGVGATDLLLSAVLAARKSPQQRVRLLAAIERIGNPLDTRQWMLVMAETRRFNGAVLSQIAHLLAWNREKAKRPDVTTIARK